MIYDIRKASIKEAFTCIKNRLGESVMNKKLLTIIHHMNIYKCCYTFC